MRCEPIFCLAFTALLINCCLFISCNKKFDEPPIYIEPDIKPTVTIQQFKARHTKGNFEKIEGDTIIAGIVIADDKTGNFFKSIVIQDESGGIALRLDGIDLFTSYPIGRKIYIKCKGLYLGDYNGLIQLGGGIDTSDVSGTSLVSIASGLFDEYIVKGSLNNVVAPKIVTTANLTTAIQDSFQSTLIQLNNFEFAINDTVQTFATDPRITSAVNFTIRNCSGNSIILRNSSYSNFAVLSVPNGNGSIVAVYTVFGSTKQLNIRDTFDVQFTSARCAAAPPPPAGIVSIDSIRRLYHGSGIRLGAYSIKGVVISDVANKNISSGNIILQDGNRGIAVYFGGSVTYNLGDSLVLNVTGDSLISYNGSLEIKRVYGSAQSAAVATGKTVIPRPITIQQLNDSIAFIEYTLIQIPNATASGGNIYAGNNTLSDVSGVIILYTATGAVFANDPLPAGAHTWMGYAYSFGNIKEFQIRNTNDVSADTTSPPPSTEGDLLITEYVEGSSYNKYLEIYNAGSASTDLSKYMVKLYANGGVNATNAVKLDTLIGAASLAPGSILVMKNSNAVLTLPAGVTAYSSGVCNFNGDDAITIEKDGIIIDVFGTVGTDPGTSWTIAGDANAAVNKTVRRKTLITKGNINWADAATKEWEVISVTDDVSKIGSR